MVLREFIGTIYHEMEIHKSGAFGRGKRQSNVDLTDTRRESVSECDRAR